MIKKYAHILLAVAAVLLLSCRPAPAATYNQAGFGAVNTGQSTAVTVTNPMGWQAGSAGAGAAGLNMGAAIPLTALPPSGNAVSPAVAATALGLIAGVPIAVGVAAVTPTITNPGAALSVAGGLMTTAGWMLAGTPAGAPLIAAGMAVSLVPAACAAVSGCKWMQAMAAQGVTVDGSGSVLKTPLATVAAQYANMSPGWNGTFNTAVGWDYWYDYSNGGHFATAMEACKLFSASNTYFGASNPGAGWQAINCLPGGGTAIHDLYCPTGYTKTITSSSSASCVASVLSCPVGYTISGANCNFSGSPVPASNADIVAAINGSTAANNQAAATAEQNAAGADMINLALLGALNMSSLNYQTLQTQVASSFSELSKSTDNLGNTVQTLSRTVSTIPAQGPTPANVPFSPQVIQQNQTVTVTNGTATQAVENTATPPANLIASATNNPTPTADLCAEHPDILACANLAILNDLAAVSAPSQSIEVGNMTPVSVGGPAICPPPFVMPGMMGGPPVTVDLWNYPCRLAVMVKPFTIVLASLASMFILIGAFKNG